MRRLAVLATTALIAASPAAAAAIEGDAAKRPFCPKGAERGERFDASRLVGKPVPKARAMAARHECLLRVVRRNGEWLTVTTDLLTNRINVAVRDGIVKRVVGIG